MEHKIYYTAQSHRDIEERLVLFPESGARVSTVSGANYDVRYLVIGKYLAFYRVVGSEVIIDRVLYGARDYLRILFGDLPAEETE